MEFGYFTLSDNNYEGNTRDAQPVREGPHRRSALCRPARHAFGLDRRASLQFARREFLARDGAGLYRRAHQAYPPCARRHRAAAAQSDPRCRAMGDARSALRRPRRFRRRPRLRPARISCRSACRSRTTSRSSTKAWRSCASSGARTASASTTRASITSSRMCVITPQPVQNPMPIYVALVLQALDRARRAAELRADRRAVRRRHELRRPEAGRRPLS